MTVTIFSFTAPATSEIYTLSLHDALPIWSGRSASTTGAKAISRSRYSGSRRRQLPSGRRSEEHTSELQSRENLVCRLLLEKKKPSEQVLHDVGNSHLAGLVVNDVIAIVHV